MTNTAKKLTTAMLRELRSIADTGEPSWVGEYGGSLAFYARDRVLDALIARGLIVDAETITDMGRAAIQVRP